MVEDGGWTQERLANWVVVRSFVRLYASWVVVRRASTQAPFRWLQDGATGVRTRLGAELGKLVASRAPGWHRVVASDGTLSQVGRGIQWKLAVRSS